MADTIQYAHEKGKGLNVNSDILPGSTFNEVCLTESQFINADMSGVIFDDINLSNAKFNNVNLSGAKFTDINLSQAQFDGVSFPNAQFLCLDMENSAFKKSDSAPVPLLDLTGVSFEGCNLRNVEIKNCNIEGMTIDGDLVSDLIEKMNPISPELKCILTKFSESGWDLIDSVSKEYLTNGKNRDQLIEAIKKADEECGSCGCEFDPLYKRALELL